MTSHASTEKNSGGKGGTRRKVFALAAAGAVLGIGATATLAAWTDSEWVFGGDGAGGPGIGTSTFEVQQNTVAPFNVPTDFVSEDTNPGGEITFGLDALDISPGDAVYSAMSLRTTATSLAGTVELQPAVPAAGIAVTDPDELLFDALEVRVATSATPIAVCDATAFSGAPGAPTVIADGPLGTTGGTATQALAAAAGGIQYYCFEVSLPDPFVPATGFTADDYMGLTAAPAWNFEGEAD
ncbi:SipW-dependent-type signal peptide-containing protein [Herbiconiux solani]|uniref:SipW-dependent-type signal peptide-containing protein n=1 Tax=Herbiconiux solani TaxID=661329 RepID=UPI000826AAD3|nr:SipW-dependent-type signal peptide-containing protein [Herbiconiux solani]